jgi:regulator of cell morphogenesis and NO signaling
MEITSHTLVADVAATYPGTLRVFQAQGIDFCCGGKRPLAEVCDEKGLPFDDLRRDLLAAIAGTPPDGRSWTEAPLGELVEHIVARYHVWLRQELPRLTQMMDKVLSVHGQRHPELPAVAHTLRALVADIEPHLMKEERVLFPFIVRLEAASSLGGVPEDGCFGSVENPIRVMEAEHEVVGDLLRHLRAHTSGFAPPEDACNTYRGLYHGLAELECELHEHIHIENNVLHPRALALEQRVLAA